MRSDRPDHWPDEAYAVVAYVLNLNGIIGNDQVMDAKSLPKVKMPNREGFISDPRPDPAKKAKHKALGSTRGPKS
jgi:cytochrome c